MPVDDDPTTGNEVQDNAPDQGNIPGPNPAWKEVLDVLPEQFHSVVTPHFVKWDQAAQSRIEAANASLKEYESYKPFVEHGITNQEIEQGLRILYEVNNNPQNVYNALANAYKFGQTPATNGPSVDDNDDPEDASTPNPQVQQLQQGLELVSKIVLADAQAKQDAQADIELDRELESLKEKHGEYDLRYVLAMMQNGMSGEEAVQSFLELRNSFAPKQQSFAPSILGGNQGGAGIPSGAIDPTKLTSGETRNLVAQMLAAAKNQN